MSPRAGFGNPFEQALLEARPYAAGSIPGVGRTALAKKVVETPAQPISLEVKPGITALISTDIAYSKLDGLFRASGWEARGREEWERILQESDDALSLWDGDKLVAFARMSQAEDDVTCTFHDAVVLPKYRRQGLLTEMQTVAQGYAIAAGYQRAQIEAVPGTEELYEHLGWAPRELGRMTLQPDNSVRTVN